MTDKVAEVGYVDAPFDWKYRPLRFHREGLQETASGYGGKLTSDRVIRVRGEKVWRRVYIAQFSNAGTAYVLIKGVRLVLRDFDFSAEPLTE